MPEEAPTTPRFDALHELLTRAEGLGGTVQLSIHDVPVETALHWLQLGLLDLIERGAGNANNPPTGTMEAGDHLAGKTTAVVFTDGPTKHDLERWAARADETVGRELESMSETLHGLGEIDGGEAA